jgi:hypothetical protein
MGTKLGAWITGSPFHKGGNLPARAASARERAGLLVSGQGWYARGASSHGS